MKILIFNSLYYPNFRGGAEKSVQYLAEKFIQKGHLVTVLSTTNKQDYIEKINNVQVYYLNMQNLYWGFNEDEQPPFKKLIWHAIDSYNFLITKKITKILMKEMPDIIHTNNISGFSVSIWKLINQLQIKIVHTLRDYHLLCPRVTMYKNGQNCINQCLKCKMYSIPKKELSQKVDAVVGISSYILEKHLNYGYFTNTTYQKVFGNNVGTIHSIPKKFNPNLVVFGFIGQIKESKGIEFLLSIFKKFESATNWKLLIAGTGNKEYIDLLKVTYLSNRIIYLGKTNPDSFYNKIDVLIIPSLWQEPFGRVVIEGLKHNKHVLGSSRGGIIDLLPKEKLFNPNTDELKHKIKNILSQGAIPQASKYSDTNSVDEYINLFKNILTIT